MKVPRRLPDLTPLDFWLSDYIKSRVHRNSPSSLVQLKEAIRYEISCIHPDAAVNSAVTSLQTVICGDGGHIEKVINELSMQVNDMKGKFIKPPLKKVSRFEYGKFEKLMRAAKKADNDFRANLKSVGPSTKFKLDEDVKEAKPDWALGAKKEQAEE